MTKPEKTVVEAALPVPGDVRVYEYGCRVDKDCREAISDQIFSARRLYNDLVACEREIVEAMRMFVSEKAGSEAQAVERHIALLNETFAAARAKNNEAQMKRVAQERREAWRERSVLVKAARTEYRSQIQERFLSRIGKRATCDTYKLRCKAVADGLGWATANAVLDAALIAFKKSFTRGMAPRFKRAAEIDQDTLTLQFTAAGGVPAATLLAGGHREFAIKPRNGSGRRKYGQFRFRLGGKANATDATGTWQYHRPLPDDAAVGLVRLVRRRIGYDYRWALQLMVRAPLAVDVPQDRSPLCAVHMGWAADDTGRRVAGITSGADPSMAKVLQLPPEIETALQRVSEVQAERSIARDAVVARIKAEAWPKPPMKVRDEDVAAQATVKIAEELVTIRRLPAQHVAMRRLHRLCWDMRTANILPEWLAVWRKKDRARWTLCAHGARRARNRRRTFYRDVAIELARKHTAIVIERPDLATAVVIVEEKTGERTEFAKKARAGRVVAALYELDSALRWAARKCDTAVFDLKGATASRCSLCGSDEVVADDKNSQQLHCHGCGAELDRKANGAAMAWQLVGDDLEGLVESYWAEALAEARDADEKRTERKRKMAEGRRKARLAKRADGGTDAGAQA